jgi:hypothetical protein
VKYLILLLASASFACARPVFAQTTQPDQPATGLNCAAGSKSNSCEQHIGVFNTPQVPSGFYHRFLNVNDLTTYGPSINFGNAGGWTVTAVSAAPHVVFGTSGIDQYMSANVIKNGTGDLAGLYLYVYGGGRAAQSDEGVTGATIESGEIPGYFHGTIASGAAPGATSLTLTDNTSAPHDWHYTCDGCMLLDISKGTIAGTNSVNGAPASLPVTKAWCTILKAIPPTDTAGIGTPRTVGCTLGSIGGATPAFRAGQIATIAGKWYPEQVLISQADPPSGGVQTLTFAARNPNPVGSILFQGGIAGQSLSFDDNLALTGFRTSYYVFGSLDGANLIYGSQIAGNLTPAHLLPRFGADAETTTSGYHLYPSAEIVANTAQPSSPTLEPNAVNWEAGDTVEDPRFQSFGGIGLRDVCSAYTPSDEGNATGCLGVQVVGPGVSGTYHPFTINNENKLSLYTQGGGKLSPVPAILTVGPFGDLMVFGQGPSSGPRDANAVINITHTANNDNTPFNLFALPTGGYAGAATVSYDPGTRLIGFPQGIVTATLGTPQNCAVTASPGNCNQASAGSFALPAGASSITIDTSRVTPVSEILITPDASLSNKLNTSCNTNPASAFAPYGITARVPGRSFTLSIATPANAPNCYSFTIVN